MLSAQDKLERAVIDTYLDFRTLLEYISELNFPCGENAPVFCPFHENTDTKAAHLYVEKVNEEFGSSVAREHIFCFAENKTYYPHDVVELLDFPFTRNKVFSSIWSILSDTQKALFDNYAPVKSIRRDFSPLYNGYMNGTISFSDLLTALKINETSAEKEM